MDSLQQIHDRLFVERQHQQSEIEAYEQDNQYLANLLHFRTVTDILNLPEEKQKEVLNAWIQKEEKMESDIADWMVVAKDATADNGSVDIIGGESIQFPATPKGIVASGGKLHQTPSGHGSKLKALPVDAQGQVILPLFLGRSNIRVSILHLGYLPSNPTALHNEQFIYPIGFLSKRKFYDIADGTKKTYYQCKITADPKSSPEQPTPWFQIFPQSEAVVMEGPDLNILFDQFMSKFDAFAKMETEWPLFHSGEEFFGLDHPPIKKYIEELPFAFNCLHYKATAIVEGKQK